MTIVFGVYESYFMSQLCHLLQGSNSYESNIKTS